MFVVRPFQATTLAWWSSEREQLDLAPAYQRSSGVWSDQDKAFLIDSIINGFDIPKFYIADFSYVSSQLNSTGKPYAVIDGRQRFEAIFDFLDGKVRLNRDMEYLGEEKLELGGMNIQQLRETHVKVAQRIENFNIAVMSVITDEEFKINELFVRLNRSKPLTGAEVRSAMAGRVPQLIRELAAHNFFRRRVSFASTRKQAENVAAKLLLIEHRGDFVETKKINLDRFAKEAILTETEFDAAANRVRETLDVMDASFGTRDSLLRTSGAIPVYYWLAKSYSGSLLRDGIRAFDDYRKAHPTEEDVVEYSQASRSVNDPHSYRVRFSLLRDFVEWQSPREVKPGQSYEAGAIPIRHSKDSLPPALRRRADEYERLLASGPAPDDGWQDVAVKTVLALLPEAHRKVIERAIHNGGWVTRSEVYGLIGRSLDKSLKGFTRPTRSVTETLQRGGWLRDGAEPLLSPIYDESSQTYQQTQGFCVPVSIVRKAHEAF
ncbi:MAG TPA: DUF262 domain-containing protein [Ramlibacter sp.]|jgi:hypothetical protein